MITQDGFPFQYEGYDFTIGGDVTVWPSNSVATIISLDFVNNNVIVQYADGAGERQLVTLNYCTPKGA